MGMNTYTVNPTKPQPVPETVKEFENDLFNNKPHYLAFKAKWGELVTSGQLKPTRWQILLYNLLRQTSVTKGFTEPTNSNKLNSGYMPYNWGFTHAKGELRWKDKSALISLFDGLLTEEMIAGAIERL